MFVGIFFFFSKVKNGWVGLLFFLIAGFFGG